MPKRRIKNFQGRNFKKNRESDKQSSISRSLQMSKIHSKGTKLELFLASLLKNSISNKFKVNVTELKGKPDIVFLKDKLCIFIDSDFWHGWQYPRWKHLLKDDSWREKISNNRKRDVRTSVFLKKHEWKVLRIWEHQLNNEVKVLARVKLALKQNRKQ